MLCLPIRDSGVLEREDVCVCVRVCVCVCVCVILIVMRTEMCEFWINQTLRAYTWVIAS